MRDVADELNSVFRTAGYKQLVLYMVVKRITTYETVYDTESPLVLDLITTL